MLFKGLCVSLRITDLLSPIQTSGMFESWMQKLVAAMMQREPESNVVIVDWLPMAHQLYPDAVNHTHQVGLSVATTINWLQVMCV